MACKQDSKVIGDHEYFVRQLPAKESLVLQFKLVQILGGALASIGVQLKDSPSETEVIKLIGSMLQQVTTGKDPDELMNLLVEIVCGAMCDGKRITVGGSNTDKTYSFNDLFNGNLTAIFEVVAFVITVNYADFLKGLLELGAPASPKAASANELTA